MAAFLLLGGLLFFLTSVVGLLVKITMKKGLAAKKWFYCVAFSVFIFGIGGALLPSNQQGEVIDESLPVAAQNVNTTLTPDEPNSPLVMVSIDITTDASVDIAEQTQSAGEQERKYITPPEEYQEYFIGNTNSRIFHVESCAAVSNINKSETIRFPYDQAIQRGYKPCERCNPTEPLPWGDYSEYGDDIYRDD